MTYRQAATTTTQPEIGRVLDALAAREPVEQWLATAADAPTSARVRIPEVLRAPLLSVLATADARALLVVVDSDQDAEQLASEASWYLGASAVSAYVSRGTAWGSGVALAPLRAGRRAQAREVAHSGGLVVASMPALTERVPAAGARADAVTVSQGGQYDRDALVADLVERGYRRVERVEEHGEVAVRGDIVDVFGSTDQTPHRLEFFDDEIEGIRRFSVFTQRSLGEVSELRIEPAAEVLAAVEPVTLSDDERAEADGHVRDPLLDVLIAQDDLEDALDAFSRCRVVRWQPQRLDAAANEALALTGLHGVDARGYCDRASIQRRLARGLPADPLDDLAPFRFQAERPIFTATGFSEAENDLAGLVAGRELQVVLSFIHGGLLQRVAAQLRKVTVEPIADMPREAPATAWHVLSDLGQGFVSTQLGLAVVPSGRLFRERASTGEAPPVGPTRAITAFTDLKPGDFVVHEDHGIGRFARFETRTVGGITRDYLYIEFAGDDRLYIPHEQIHKITRYIGADGSAPKLSRFGGKRWQQLRNRATRAVRELAGELLALYAHRAKASGMEQPPDADLMARFEAAFPYEETPDQERAIAAVAHDMARPQPMDRLVCGDVGFGKTEVAMRAAAQAVSAGRQVMVLVPTTVLAQQHLNSFRERFAGLPVEIDMVSRFRTRTAIDSALERFRDGKLDILVGTHRLLSRDVMPKDLGLVVVDEEQRFGVQQKETLRQLRSEVDVLAMSATPIPRTLHMSLAGLRDISVIETPPRGRRSIATYVGEYDETLVRDAIERELKRNGQVFYLHNRVQSIDEAAAKLAQIVPDARIRIGHGQMGEHELERVMTDFVDGEFDVLVSTTIIESGLDIPSANTLIVERADVFGLSQLHQIRGRVGRSDRSAHAYLLYPSRRELTEEASARLTTLGDYSDLGAGTRIAMRDLEIRGAGNLLGAEQSGHVAAIGFELYVELLANAVAEISGQPQTSRRGGQIDIRIDAYIPADYVYSEAEKIELHRRMGLAREDSDLDDLREEMIDRYGEIPEPVENLLAMARLRLAMSHLGVTRLSIDAGRVVVQPLELDADSATELRVLEPSAAYSRARRQVSAQVPRPEHQLDRAAELLGNLRRAMLK